MTSTGDSKTVSTQDIQDSSYSLIKAVAHFFSGTALSRLSGMARDMLMAFAFGADPFIAAFMIAFRFSNLLRRMFGEGAMQSAFTPLFEELRKEGFDKATHFFKELIASLTLFLLLIIALVEIALLFAYLYLNLNQDNLEIIQLTAVMFPGVIFICLYGINAAFLQCQGRFFLSSAAPIAFNVIWILSVLLFQSLPVKEAVFRLSIGVVVAYFFQWVILLPNVMPLLKRGLNFPIRVFSKGVKRLLKPLSLGILAVSASQINSTIDPLFARSADLEGPAYLWYAIRLQQLPLALLGIAFSGALLPALSRAVKSLDIKKYAELLHYGLRKVLSLMIPITFAVFTLGFSSVNFLYGRGDFNNRAVIETTYCLWGYALGIVPMTLVLLFSSAAFASSRFSRPAIAAFLSMFLNALLNAIFIFILDFSAFSVAVATSIAAYFNCFMMSTSAPHRQYWAKELGVFKILTVSLLAFAMTLFFGFYLIGDPSIYLIRGDSLVLFSYDFSNQVLSLGLQALFYAVALLIFARLLRADDLLALLRIKLKSKV